MHINYIDDGDFILFINREKKNCINFDVYEEIENYFRKLFRVLKKVYNIKVSGYYDIKIYKDNIYGMVIEVKNEDIDYSSIFDNEVEMSIEVINTNILYEIDDYYFLDCLDNICIYSYKNKLYVYLKNEIDKKSYLRLMEFSKIIYGSFADKIVKNGRIINDLHFSSVKLEKNV